MNPIRKAIVARLSGDGALNALLDEDDAIYHRKAPQGKVPPYVLFHKQGGSPRRQFQGESIDPELWTVKGVDRGSESEVAEDIAERCRELLDNAELVIDGRRHLDLFRDGDVDYGEVDAGEQVHHVGHIFRVVTERT